MQRKGILQFIKNCLRDGNYNSVIYNTPKLLEEMKKLLKDLYKHYGFLDISKGSNHQHRFELLYLSEDEMTFEEIVLECNLTSVATLQKFVRNYNELALNFIKIESHVNLNYVILLEEYYTTIK